MAQQTTFSDLSADPSQFKQDLEAKLSASDVWKGNLTTQVGTALVDSIAALGAFCQQQIMNAYTNCFQETAVLDDAIKSIAIMQGTRLTRRLPASMKISLTSELDTTIPAFTQFLCAGYSFFNREVITLKANKAVETTLHQGSVHVKIFSGVGTELQSFVSDEDGFSVSDSDVHVLVNGELINKAYGSLWNYKNVPAYMDGTTAEGRLLVQFGNTRFGTMPGINDTVTIIYCTTEGAFGNNYTTVGSNISISGYSKVSGKSLENPSGGANQKSTLAYKNSTAGSFGTYGSAVTKSQYQAIVNTYPGVVDAFTQAQRERNPGDVKLMNVITVTGITTSPWNDEQKQEFCNWCQQQSMYSTRFVWIDATPVKRNVSIKLYCYNSSVLSNVERNATSAIKALFSPKSGILMTDFYISDIITAVRNADAGIAYVVVEEPTEEMIVTQPSSPDLTYEITASDGTLAPYFYSYGVVYVQADGTESKVNSWCHPQVTKANSKVKIFWKPVPSAVTYKVFGRKGESIGLLKTIQASSASIDNKTGKVYYEDTGRDTPDASQFTKYRMPELKYNSLGKLTVVAEFADRQQRVSTLTSSGS